MVSPAWTDTVAVHPPHCTVMCDPFCRTTRQPAFMSRLSSCLPVTCNMSDRALSVKYR